LAVASPQIQLTSCEKFTALLALHGWISGKGALRSEKRGEGMRKREKKRGKGRPGTWKGETSMFGDRVTSLA